MKTFTTYTVAGEYEGFTVEGYMKEILQYSGRKIQKLTRQKGIKLNGKIVFLEKKVKTGDNLRILNEEDTGYGVQPEEGKVTVLYEDSHLFVLNKPPYQLVHPTGQTTSGTLANYFAYELQQRKVMATLRPVHRLDRETSGCIIFAKDSRSQFILEQQLKDRRLKRTYWALVKGIVTPQSGTIDAPIGPHPTLANRRAIDLQGETAVTHYRTVENFADATLVELTLETGRTHQIRLHLSHLGYPIIGDRMYGTRPAWMKRQALHAISIRYIQPTNQQEMTIQAPLPEDFTAAIGYCRQQMAPTVNQEM